MRSVIRVIAFVAVASAMACTNRDSAAGAAADTTVARNSQSAPIDPQRALDVKQYLTSDYITAHGSCLATDPAPAKSRIVYAILANESSYLRLNVVSSSDGTRPEMIDLVRGASGGRIWSAVLPRGSSSIAITTFASANDRSPQTQSLPADGPEGRQLRDDAAVAMQLTCH